MTDEERRARMAAAHASRRCSHRIVKRGYVYRYYPEHPAASQQGYVPEHRLVMERLLERPLRSEEVVHHRNGVPYDNRPENLELFAEHGKHVRAEEHGLMARVRNGLFFNRHSRSWEKCPGNTEGSRVNLVAA